MISVHAASVFAMVSAGIFFLAGAVNFIVNIFKPEA